MKIIALMNERGGSGKSTATNLVIALHRSRATCRTRLCLKTHCYGTGLRMLFQSRFVRMQVA